MVRWTPNDSSLSSLFFASKLLLFCFCRHGHSSGMHPSQRPLRPTCSPAPSQHYIWAAGHFLLLTASLRYIVAWATFKSASALWYKGLFPASYHTPTPGAHSFSSHLHHPNITVFAYAHSIAIVISSPCADYSQFHRCPRQLCHRLPVRSASFPNFPPNAPSALPLLLVPCIVFSILTPVLRFRKSLGVCPVSSAKNVMM